MSQSPDVLTKSKVLQNLEEFNETLDNRERKYVKCNACQHVLTHAETAISVHGSHIHVKTNPYGNAFSFRCFNEALGCAIEGDSVGADSWFPNHVWQYLHCDSCNQHLGWYFSGEETFFGIREDHSYIE